MRPIRSCLRLVLLAAATWFFADCAAAQSSRDQIEAALQNITSLVRADHVGYATVWDGNKYVQCRRMPDRSMRCEAAGSAMQPSLARILVPARLERLAALGWTLDPRFGNYAQVFPESATAASIADRILKTLIEAYAAQEADLEFKTDWVVDVPCPPRSGFSQNLAGSVNDAPSMRATALLECSFSPNPQQPRSAGSAQELIEIYGTRVAAEIQRLRINSGYRVYAVFSAGIGYIQCAPQTSPLAFYCEAQSAESWPALATILTADRVAKLKRAGYADPGRAPNYSRNYPFSAFTDAKVAGEILTLLHEVYGYNGAQELRISTE